LRQLGGDPWFNLGDQDLATHLFRTGLRTEGVSLSEITARLARALGVAQRVLPMCDTDVETWVTTQSGEEMHYQEYLVRDRCRLPLAAARLRGAEFATPAPGVVEAIRQARLIVLAPSNPVASLRPILALPGVRKAIAESDAIRIAVTPTVLGVPITDAGERNRASSRERLLALDGIAHRPSAIAHLYRGLIDLFVLDTADREEKQTIEDTGVAVLVADTLITRQEQGVALASHLLARSAALA
jgi:LPPG:FO 2-phospho-L-lactate transferase